MEQIYSPDYIIRKMQIITVSNLTVFIIIYKDLEGTRLDNGNYAVLETAISKL